MAATEAAETEAAEMVEATEAEMVGEGMAAVVKEEVMGAAETVAAEMVEVTAAAAMEVVVTEVVTGVAAMAEAKAGCPMPRRHSNARQASRTPHGS